MYLNCDSGMEAPHSLTGAFRPKVALTKTAPALFMVAEPWGSGTYAALRAPRRAPRALAAGRLGRRGRNSDSPGSSVLPVELHPALDRQDASEEDPHLGGRD